MTTMIAFELCCFGYWPIDFHPEVEVHLVIGEPLESESILVSKRFMYLILVSKRFIYLIRVLTAFQINNGDRCYVPTYREASSTLQPW